MVEASEVVREVARPGDAGRKMSMPILGVPCAAGWKAEDVVGGRVSGNTGKEIRRAGGEGLQAERATRIPEIQTSDEVNGAEQAADELG